MVSAFLLTLFGYTFYVLGKSNLSYAHITQNGIFFFFLICFHISIPLDSMLLFGYIPSCWSFPLFCIFSKILFIKIEFILCTYYNGDFGNPHDIDFLHAFICFSDYVKINKAFSHIKSASFVKPLITGLLSLKNFLILSPVLLF